MIRFAPDGSIFKTDRKKEDRQVFTSKSDVDKSSSLTKRSDGARFNDSIRWPPMYIIQSTYKLEVSFHQLFQSKA